MKKRDEQSSSWQLSRRLLKVFLLAAIVLVPWTIWLSSTLPADHLDRHWDLVWTGFDVGLIISLGLTAYLGLRKSGWVVAAATASGTFLLIDAWFDSLTANKLGESHQSLLTAIFIELPLALLAFWTAYHAGKHFFDE